MYPPAQELSASANTRTFERLRRLFPRADRPGQSRRDLARQQRWTHLRRPTGRRRQRPWSGVSTPSPKLSSTMTLTVPPNRRNARSWSSAQICALDRHVSSRTHLREQPSVSTKRRTRRYLPVVASRTIGPSPP